MAIDARVHPAVPVDRSRLLVTLGVFERVFLAVRRYWNSIQVGHRGRYSAERLLAFQEYYQRTSPGRAFMVCFLAVLPPFVVAILAEFIPLRPPHEGWKANYMYWISLFVSSLPISTGGVYQVREIIEPGTISMTGVVVTAVRSCTVNVVLTMILAVLWEFPVPFGYVMTVVGPFIGSYMILFLLSVGPRVLASSPMLHRQIFTQMLVIAAQGTLAIAYPTFGAIFNQLSIIGQTVFIFVLPMIKFSIKQFIANTSAHLHEYVGPTVVLSVDVCNVLYVAICVQTAVSPLTSGLQIASDAFFVVMGLRSIYHQSEVSQARQRLISMNSNLPPTLNYIRNLRALLREAFQSPRASERVPIRIRAPFPLPLSDESKAFMEELEHVRRRCSVETEFGKDMRLESITTGSFHARSHYNEWREPSDILSSPKAILVNSSHDYMVTHSTQLTASGTAFDRPILAHQEPSAAPTVNSFPQSKRSRMSGTVGPYHLEVVTSNVQDSSRLFPLRIRRTGRVH